MTPEQMQIFAGYNRWMNDNLYQAAGRLSPQDFRKDLGAFFGSVCGTLNHIVVADLIWLRRYLDLPKPPLANDDLADFPIPSALDEIITIELQSLITIRQSLDSVIVRMAEGLNSEQLASSLVYYNTKGKKFKRTFGLLLLHFFNHQTHHRGQVTTLLNQLGVAPGVTDLLVRLPELPLE